MAEQDKWQWIRNCIEAKVPIDAEDASVAELLAERDAQAERIGQLEEDVHRRSKQYNEALEDAEGYQAEIDRLMLEYCPDEMTQAQKDNWAAHQKVAEEDGTIPPRVDGKKSPPPKKMTEEERLARAKRDSEVIRNIKLD